jgi:hypothetical protein
VECLILSGRGDVAPDRQVTEERRQFSGAQLARVALVVKEDEAADPLQVRVLGANAVVPDTDELTHLVEQT